MRGPSQGEKLKKLRKDLNLKQEDLTNDQLSKSLISMIEKDKRKLTTYTATIIANSLNKYYESMNKKITAEFLMETEEDKIRKQIRAEGEFLNSLIDSKKVEEKLIMPTFDNLIDLAEEWGLKEEIMFVIALRGKCYYSLYKYNESLKDLSTALEYYIGVKNHSEVARIYNCMGTCYYMQMSLERAVDYFAKSYDVAFQHSTPNRARVKIEAVFNMILSYRKLKKYDMAIQNIALFKELDSEHEIFNYYNDQVMLLEANTYREIGNFDRAEKLYEKLLQRSNELNKNAVFFVYTNLSHLYREQGKLREALEYANKAFDMRNDIDSYYFSIAIMIKAKSQVLLGEYKEVLESLKLGLDFAKSTNRFEMIIDFHFTLVQIYIQMKDYDNALEYLKDVEAVILEKDIKSKQTDLFSFYVEIYLALDQKEKCLEYVMKNRQDYFAN